MTWIAKARILAILVALASFALSAATAGAADPVRVGFSMSLTGGSAANGKQHLLALQVWRDDVNAKGGLLGRPVELVYYDDQSNPASVPGIYTKLMDIDKVDLLVGPYSTNMIAPAIPVMMQHNMLTVGILGLAANSEFHYPKYFSMIASGPEPKLAYSKGFFDLAVAQNPKPKTVAIVAADAEFAKNSADGARENVKALGLQVVYDRSYPPMTTDFGPTVRAIQAVNPDIVFVASYPLDTVGLIRAAAEAGLKAKIFGGTMIGLLATPIRVQLGPLMNNVAITEMYVPAPSFDFPGGKEFFRKFQAQAHSLGVDPLGYSQSPFGYAAGQVLEAAVEGAKTLDQDKLAAYMREHSFETIVGPVKFGKDGEWDKPRVVITQFQHVIPNDIEQFRGASHEVIVWPPEVKTGEFVYPYPGAQK